MFDPCHQTYSLLLGCHTNTWVRFTYFLFVIQGQAKVENPEIDNKEPRLLNGWSMKG